MFATLTHALTILVHYNIIYTGQLQVISFGPGNINHSCPQKSLF